MFPFCVTPVFTADSICDEPLSVVI